MTKTDIIPAAYIGVSGETLRVRVPVRRITLTRAEGPTELCGDPKVFDTWHGADWQLLQNQKTAPKSGYDKHDFVVEWADGRTYSGRFDLTQDGSIPSLAAHIREFLTFLADEERTQGRPWILAEDRDRARDFLVTHDIQQPHPDLAPEDWPVLRDYRTEPLGEDEPLLADLVYEKASEN